MDKQISPRREALLRLYSELYKDNEKERLSMLDAIKSANRRELRELSRKLTKKK